MILAEHTVDKGWGELSLEPRADVGVDLAAGALQYGLSIFEGLKAYRRTDGKLQLFRPDAHARRLAQSAVRLCMPAYDEKLAGVIHTDFERGFIKAEICRVEDLLKFGSESALREKGLLRIEGKDYVMQDGDVAHFRFDVS